MKHQTILVFNCGSSSIKTQVVDPRSKEVFFKDVAEEVVDYGATIDQILNKISGPVKQTIIGVGHRVVHGGEYFSASCIIDQEVLDKIKECSALAPLHNPYNVMGIEKLQAIFDVPHVAVFDTSFHASMPDYASLYPVDYKLYEDHHVKRYGFHGTSHRYVTTAVSKVIGKTLEKTEFISAHLGGGASLCATAQGKSIETSMGLSPAEGLMMATRSGNIDPTLFSFLNKQVGMTLEEAEALINKKSGLLGVSGISGDLRDIEKAMGEGDKRAILAFEMFCYRLSKMIASYTVVVPNLDALIFTGGIGENSDAVRARVCQWLAPLGVSIDLVKNKDMRKGKSGIISDSKSSFSVCVCATDEELLIAQDTLAFGFK